MALDPYCALVVVLSGALAVHVYTWVGVPVSSSQAVVGAVLGVGILKGTQTIRHKDPLFHPSGLVRNPPDRLPLSSCCSISSAIFATFPELTHG